MWSQYIMNIIFIIITVILFILTQPGLFITIPTKHMIYFVLLHGLLFTASYVYIKTYFTEKRTLEGFDDKEKEFLEEESKKIDKLFSKYTVKEMQNKTEEEVQKMVDEEMAHLSPEQQARLKEYKIYKLEKNEKNEKNEMDDDKNELANKLDYIFNNSSVEQIQYFDSLSEERQTAFERIVDNMTTEKIDKYLKLDIAKLEKSVQEVVEISK